jgi:phosphatidate phosphatase APP1
MSDENRGLASFLNKFEGQVGQLKEQWQERSESDRPLKIVPYFWFGSDQLLQVAGRVLVDPGKTTFRDNENIWDSLGDMYRRFESDAVPFPRVCAQYGDVSAEVEGDEDGFFIAEIAIDGQLMDEQVRQEVELTLLDQPEDNEKVSSKGKVIVPPQNARFGVISDIDDTVIYSHARDFLKMARTVILEDAKGRTPFPGVAAFYRGLYSGLNPLFFVSSSPWNMYDLFSDLFELQGIPQGPLLLRDWGIKPNEYFPREHKGYKLKVIRGILDFYPHMPFILIGDSGQEDPEIYHEIIELYPGRIQVVYIRLVNQDEARVQSVTELAKSVQGTGTSILLAEDTMVMANHAARKGWISEDDASKVASSIAEY